MDEIQSIQHAFELAQADYERWGSESKEILHYWQMIYVRLYFITQLIKAHQANQPDAILNLIIKLNKDNL